MNERIERLRFDAAKAREEAATLLDQVDAEKDATRAGELNEQAKALVARSTELDERANMREKLEVENEAAEARALSQRGEERGYNGGSLSADSLNREVTVEDIRERNLLLERFHAGESMSEEESKRANETFPAERLFFKAMVDNTRATSNVIALTSEERTLWDGYQAMAKRAITPTMQAGTDTLGGTFVPETLVRRIFQKMLFYGPMNDIGLVTQFTTNTTGDFKLPTVLDHTTKKAAIVDEGADATRSTITTGSVTLNARKYSFQLPVTFELLMAGNVDFEAWLTSEVGEFFARALNEHFTTGDGNNKPTGIIPASAGLTAANRVLLAGGSPALANPQPTEEQIFSLFALLDRSYMGLPSTRFMCHNSMLFRLMSLRQASGTGERTFDLTADRRMPILPGGVPIVVNNDVPFAGANAVNAVLGPLSYYLTLRAGGMRANSDYVQISDQYTLAWFEMRDGKPLFPAAADKTFVFLRNPAS